jgi:CHAP domain
MALICASVVALPIITFVPAGAQGIGVGVSISPISVPGAVGAVTRISGLQPLFPDVPAGGYPHSTYPQGQCTWYVAYNRRVPPYMGDGWQWLGSAVANGMATSSQPAVGSIVVYKASPGYDTVHGHVAIVIALGSGFFRVSEMNYTGLGVIDERNSPWPDWHVEGFITK